MQPTDVQRRILEDFADPNPMTRHTRSRAVEFRAELPKLLSLGWLARGRASNGQAHFITAGGRAAIGEKRRVRLLSTPRIDDLAADWLREHRHGVDTSEAFDDLRDLLAQIREEALEDAAKLAR
jgi:hypothetical protein